VAVDLTVRRARSGDRRGVQETLARSWRRGYDGVLEADALAEATADPTEFSPEERFERKRADDEFRFLVAVVDDGVAGVCNVASGESNTHTFVSEGAAQHRAVYVDPDHWGEGIGSALVRRGSDAPDDATPEHVECLTANERGRRFYDSLGFERYDRGSVDLFGNAYPTDRFRR